ncbi:TasA family protein [Halarchaeum sp. P4]|uniref:TasA family protein n=1 Tax=Halarchaeum sp. P4 TaxID=3421639 RepID=UPI003EB9D42F
MADIQLTRRTVLAAVVAVGLVAAGAGAGTMALFSDQETSDSNTIQAGTLNLNALSANQGSVSLGLSDVKPTDSGTQNLTLTNSGSLDGTVTVALNETRDYENSVKEPEGSDTTDTGELSKNVTYTIGVDSNADGAIDVALANGNLSSIDNQALGTFSLNASETKYLVIDYTVDEGATNDIQSDSIAYNVSATIEQKGA